MLRGSWLATMLIPTDRIEDHHEAFGFEQNQQGCPGSGSGGANTQSYDYSGSYSGVLSADGTSATSVNETLTATSSDQNAVLSQNGATLTVKGASITKSGDSDNADNCNFYGTNSSVLAVGSGTTLNIADQRKRP